MRPCFVKRLRGVHRSRKAAARARESGTLSHSRSSIAIAHAVAHLAVDLWRVLLDFATGSRLAMSTCSFVRPQGSRRGLRCENMAVTPHVDVRDGTTFHFCRTCNRSFNRCCNGFTVFGISTLGEWYDHCQANDAEGEEEDEEEDKEEDEGQEEDEEDGEEEGEEEDEEEDEGEGEGGVRIRIRAEHVSVVQPYLHTLQLAMSDSR